MVDRRAIEENDTQDISMVILSAGIGGGTT
jgi:hypothetical protein